jgi:hypothetical protein
MGQEALDSIVAVVITVVVIGVAAVCCIPLGVIIYKIFQLMTYRKTEAEILNSWTTQQSVTGGETLYTYHVTYAYMYKGVRYETTVKTSIQRLSRSGKIRHSRSNPKKIYKAGGILIAIICSGPAAFLLLIALMFLLSKLGWEYGA